MKTAYIQVKDYFSKNPEYAFTRSRWFNCITEIKPKHLSVPPNIYFEYISHIKNELDGGLIDRYYAKEDGEFEHTYGCFFGITVLPEVAKLLRRYANQEDDPFSIRCVIITNAVRYLWERLQIFREGMIWFIEERHLQNNSEIQEIVTGYNTLIDTARRNALLMEKFALTRDFSIFNKVADIIDNSFPIERNLLGKYYEFVRNECLSRYIFK